MTTKTDKEVTAGKRKAWTYEPPKAPPLADFVAGGDRRKAFLRYWLYENIDNAIDLFLYFAFMLLPASVCSDLGGWLGRVLAPRFHKSAYARAAANLKMIRPELGDAELDKLFRAYADSQGRQMAEYSVVPRLARRHVRMIGTEGLVERCSKGPVIFIAPHISNWEVLWHCLLDMGLDVTMNYDPPKRRSRHYIVNRLRKRAGLGILKPGRSFVRPALRILENGGNLLMFCDEGFNGHIRAPFFGRPVHLEGNYALIARMARRTNALIYPIYIVRETGVRFALTALKPFVLPEGSDVRKYLVHDVAHLNTVVEPIVRSHMEQWYFVDNRL
ncbi:lipid A biosynthesis lauroyl acyltransferase [Rhizobium dioscoreae]|uniref:lysophospholipid acyltransferase family protein n=1 Tax=unclassified Rhizobium TaxID=2613769 RepID=UPI000DE072A4|nr:MULTISPECIES: lipid A biosynthesis lauroyl acyltransferase [unclassified Rhizobium]MCZ3380134.1 lipid A biosynthesis lauroyl acyltransferase [Rhizobium sp. AG207R]TWB11512.1 KDO2-lipid IV(A) lauroyltransferase [Rhizobium sp. ERR1071]GES43911.1 lipid A biosynthesis lauroyl acyltransferase [Rhizobium dioscoreae]